MGFGPNQLLLNKKNEPNGSHFSLNYPFVPPTVLLQLDFCVPGQFWIQDKKVTLTTNYDKAMNLIERIW